LTTGKVLKERRAPRERGRMGSSLTEVAERAEEDEDQAARELRGDVAEDDHGAVVDVVRADVAVHGEPLARAVHAVRALELHGRVQVAIVSKASGGPVADALADVARGVDFPPRDPFRVPRGLLFREERDQERPERDRRDAYRARAAAGKRASVQSREGSERREGVRFCAAGARC